jgi:hypothetical protein
MSKERVKEKLDWKFIRVETESYGVFLNTWDMRLSLWIVLFLLGLPKKTFQEGLGGT